MSKQYDNLILSAFPKVKGEFGRERLPEELFEINPIFKQYIQDVIQTSPVASFKTMILDTNFLDSSFQKRKANSFLTNYTYEDTLLKPAMRDPSDFLTIDVQYVALASAIEKMKKNEKFRLNDYTLDNLLEPNVTKINRASNPTYLFIDPTTVQSYDDLLLACAKEPKSASVNPEEYLKRLLKINEGFENAIEEKVAHIKALLFFINQKIKLRMNTYKSIVSDKEIGEQNYEAVDTLVDLLGKKRKEKETYNDYIKTEVEKNHEFVKETYEKSKDFLKVILEIPYSESQTNLMDVTNNLYSMEAAENMLKENAIAIDLRLERLANAKMVTIINSTNTKILSQTPGLPYIDLFFKFPKFITFDTVMDSKCDYSFTVTSFETFLSLLNINIVILPPIGC